MANIKTKESLRTIKTLDRAKNIAGKLKNGAEEVKETADEMQITNYESGTEYAGNTLQANERLAAIQAAYTVKRVGNWGLRETADNIQKHRAERANAGHGEIHTEETEPVKYPASESSVETETADTQKTDVCTKENFPNTEKTPADNKPTAPDNAQRQIPQNRTPEQPKAEKSVDKVNRSETKKPNKPSPESKNGKTIKTAGKSGRSIKTSANTAKKTTEATADAGKKAAEETAKTTKKAATAAKKAVQDTIRTVEAAAKAVVEATKVVVAATKEAVAAIIAGGWIAILVIVLVCIIALVLGSVFGVFTAENTTTSGITIAETVRSSEQDLWDEINQTKMLYTYDMCYVVGEPCPYPFAIAVYATTLSGTEEAVEFDNAKVEKLKEIYKTINPYEVTTTERKETVQTYEKQEDGSFVVVEREIIKTDLTITIKPLTREKVIERYGFDDTQIEQFDELLSDETNEMWDELLNG